MKITTKQSLARSWTFSTLVAVLMVYVFLEQSRAQAQSVSVFRHGVALFHPLGWATRSGDQRAQFMLQPFSDAHHQITEAQIAAITRAGFDFVRLPVDPGPFLEFQGLPRDALDDVLRQRVQMLLAHGIAVVVDFHPNPLEAGYASQALVKNINSPVFDAYCKMLARTARLLSDLHSNRVALELINEPDVGWSRARFATWQQMAETMYSAARSATPHLTLVMPSGTGDDYQGLIALDPGRFAKDRSLIFTFHYYYPYEFTMQSEPESASRSVLLDVPYPANARPVSDSLSALSAQLDKTHTPIAERAADVARASAYLINYHVGGFDRSRIHAAFDRVSAWAKAHAVAPSRIYLGEFGVIRRLGPNNGARDSERAQWLRDIREEAEEHGFIWSIWAYSVGGGMGITNDDAATEVDPTTLKALGLR